MAETGKTGLRGRKEARIRRLQEAVSRQKSLHVRDAAELLDVSEMTIRRDIRELPELFDYLGGHIVLADAGTRRAPYDLLRAAEVKQDEKRAACAFCLPLIRPKDTIFIDCGTTLVNLVGILPPDVELTVVCYALNTADVAVRNPKLSLVMLGGAYDPATAAFLPTEDDPHLSSLAINTAFMSAAGLDMELGATCTTFREALIKRAAMARSQKRILVLDSSKIGVVKAACFGAVEEFDLILTENGPLDPV